MKESINLICGCGHSGTSLIANMFASHPEVYIPLRETSAFMKPESSLEILSQLFDEARINQKKYVMEKTPGHVRHIRQIESIVPNARFIVMVRDGRDVAASYIKRTGRAADGYERWIRDNTFASTHLGQANAIFIRYEDLVSQGERELRRACQFLELEYNPCMLEYHKTPRLWFDVSEIKKGSGWKGSEHVNLRNWQINQPIFNDSGKWKHLLNPSDLALFNSEAAKNLLQLFNYG